MNKRCNLHHPNRLFLQGRKSISECVFEALFHWSRVSSNDTSACCQHLVSQVVTRVSSRDTSACYHHLVSSIDTSTFVTREFERHIGMLSSSCDSSERDRHIIMLSQPSATSPLSFDNLHFEHFDKRVIHESRLTRLSKCSKWRLSKDRGLVADGCDSASSCESDMLPSSCG
jgi:hypothetical protein